MTAVILQKELAKEIEKILDDIQFTNPKKEKQKIKAYTQNLPKILQQVGSEQVGGYESDSDFCPYCIVRVSQGKLENPQSAHKVQTVLLFGICDYGEECQGQLALLTIFERIMQRFTRNPILANQFRLEQESGIDWALDDEDNYPFYFGAMVMTWEAGSVRREDKYA